MSSIEDDRRAAHPGHDPRSQARDRGSTPEHDPQAAPGGGCAPDAVAGHAHETGRASGVERAGDDGDDRDDERGGAAAWFCAGLLLGAWVAAAPERRPAAASVAVGPGPRIDPDALSARELRALPGIGPSRALSIVRARWDGLRGGPGAWPQIPGIGAATASAAARALEPGRGFEKGRVEPTRSAPYTRAGAP